MKNKRLLLLTSALILLPILFGLVMWESLPDQIPIHWGLDGQPDRWNSKVFAVFFMPLICLALHLTSHWIIQRDPVNRAGNQAIQKTVLWLFPCVSLTTSGMIFRLLYIGQVPSANGFLFPLLGLMLLAFGNYLPKCRQNSFIGIRVPWVYSSEENWNRTHRLGGRVWVVCGLVCIVAGLLEWFFLFFAGVCTAAFLPIAYSWWFFRRQRAEGSVPPLPKLTRGTVLGRRATALFTAGILIFVAVMLFLGEFQVALDDQSLTITTSQWDDSNVSTAQIESVTYCPDGISGSRDWGYGNFRVAMGIFSNQELGSYTRYTYASCESCILIRLEGRILVLNRATEAETQALYQQLLPYAD